MIYYGDEIGLKEGDDPDNRRDFPGGWKSDPQNAFEPEGRTPEQQSLVTHLQTLGRIRKELEPLRRGAMLELLAETDQYAFARLTPQSAVVVIFNRSSEPANLKIPLSGSSIPEGASLEDALGAAPSATVHEGKLDIRIPAHTAAIYKTK